MSDSVPHHRVAIIGTGFAGLGMAVALTQAGRDDFVVLERSGAVGGTWRDNHYPGCACDVPTPLYSFSFAPNPYWKRMYAEAEEIRAYLEEITDRYDVRRHVAFHQDLTGGSWDEEAGRWTLLTGPERVPAYTADFVVAGFGGLSTAVFPDIDGLTDFAGSLFHSADWNHQVPLEHRRVGVIGTGASGIQLIPKLAETAAEVVVFQRTATWVLPKADRPIPSIEQRLYAALPITQLAMRGVIYGITEALGHTLTRRPDRVRYLEALGRFHIRRSIRDPELRAKVTPKFRLGCKRILFSNDYLSALDRPNVTLVTDRIDRVAPTGVVTRRRTGSRGDGARGGDRGDRDGQFHELDALVCSTGFGPEEVFAGLDIRGRDGLRLTEAWADGMQAHRGTTVAGFPNLALLSGPNTGTGSTSQVFMIEAQIRYVIDMLDTLERTGASTIEVRPEAERAYNERLQDRMANTVWLTGGCASWYLSADGVNRTLYPGPSIEFARGTRHVVQGEYTLTEGAARPQSQPTPAIPAGASPL